MSTVQIGNFYLQVAPNNEGQSITVVLGNIKNVLSLTSGDRDFSSVAGALVYKYYTIPNPAYVKDSSLPAGISGSTYEAVSDTSDWTSGNLYLLELATGKIYTSDRSGSVAAQYYNCGYACNYIVTTVWTVGTEVTGTNRPDYLYAPQSTVSSPVWTLT